MVCSFGVVIIVDETTGRGRRVELKALQAKLLVSFSPAEAVQNSKTLRLEGL